MRGWLAAALVALATTSAQAQVLDRVRAAGTLHCAAEQLHGLAEIEDDGTASGTALALCRALAAEVIGPEAKIAFTTPQAGSEFDDLRAGRVDVALFSEAALAEAGVTAGYVVGPAIFEDPIRVLVGAELPFQTPAELGGATICLMTGSIGQRVLEEYLAAHAITVIRAAFREDVEMLDAFNSRNCDVVVDAASRIAEMRATPTVNRRPSRILATPLAVTPVHALVPEGDFAWAGMVFGFLDAHR